MITKATLSLHKRKYVLMDLEFQSNFHWQSFLLKGIFKILLIYNLTLLNYQSQMQNEHPIIHIRLSNKSIDLACIVF